MIILEETRPRILTPGSFEIYKLKNRLLAAGRIFKRILCTCIVRPFLWFKNKIKDRIINFYYRYHEKIPVFKKMLKKYFIKSTIIIGIIIALLYIIDFILMKASQPQYLAAAKIQASIYFAVLIGTEIVSYVLMILFLKYYHYYFGEEQIHEKDAEWTKEYNKKIAPDIATFYAPTGWGKDEEMAGKAVHKVEAFLEDIYEKIERIKGICYIFSFGLVDEVVVQHQEQFYSSSTKKTKSNFLELCRSNNFFIKRIYRRKIDLQQFEDDCKLISKNRVARSSNPYTYYEGGIAQKHFLEMLYDYCMLTIRLIEGRFIFANQPFVEDYATGRTAAVFSQNYTITKKQKDITITEEKNGKSITRQYEEKILYPFKDYHGIIETEGGTWKLNVDGFVRTRILELGDRNFKAHNRHYIPHFFWFQNDQEGNRVDKLLRELEHSYIRIDTREVYDGARFANAPLEHKLTKVTKKIIKLENKFKKKGSQNPKIVNKKLKLAKAYVYSSKEKYKDRVDRINERLRSNKLSEKAYRLAEKRYEIIQKMVLNIFDHGYIIKTVTVSKHVIEGSNYNLYNPEYILTHPDVTRGVYSVKLTYHKSDCWRYDTHYLKAIRNERADKSELNLIDCETWPSDMLFSKETAKTLGYMQAADMFGLAQEDLLKKRYKPKQVIGNAIF